MDESYLTAAPLTRQPLTHMCDGVTPTCDVTHSYV